VALKKGDFMRGKGEVLVIRDGTGFSYGSYCLIGWYRGKVMKKVKAHCKVVFVLGEGGKKKGEDRGRVQGKDGGDGKEGDNDEGDIVEHGGFDGVRFFVV